MVFTRLALGAQPGSRCCCRSLLPRERHLRAVLALRAVSSTATQEVRGEAATTSGVTELAGAKADEAKAASAEPAQREQDSSIEQRSPGHKDDTVFHQHWSVAWWRGYSWPPPGSSLKTLSGVQAVAEGIRTNAAAAGILNDAESALYWGYHIARTGFFSAQGAAALALQHARGGEGAAKAPGATEQRPGLMEQLESRLLNLPAEAMGAYQVDLKNIKAGEYRMPWDATTWRHEQNNPLRVLRQAVLFMRESAKVLRDRDAGDVGKMSYGRSNLFPDYYQNNFHFQQDGWFSSTSARVYDVMTETLFVGRQDAMQRLTLLPIRRWLDSQPASETNGALRILEVGAGTGRFATFLRDNYPHSHLTVTDLSAFYLEEAARQMRHWQRLKGKDAESATFVQCAAEKLPFDDASMDVVYSVYMFHEMPKEARDQALLEFARVLRPGGLVVVTDSVQYGDRPQWDARLGLFQRLNEPHYPSYVEYDFGEAFKQAGLVPDMKALQSATKCLSARKGMQ